MGKYDDMLYLSHPVSKKHLPMSILDRAAQFAPFAALTGHSAAIKETARYTTKKMDLDEDSRWKLDLKQQLLKEIIHTNPEIIVTYFKQDEKKSGGCYLTITGRLKKIDKQEQILCMYDGRSIPVKDITEIESSCFVGLF